MADGIPAEAKVLYYERFGGPEVAKLGTLPVPEVGEGDVLVKIHAASFNPIDFKRRSGALKLLSSETFPVRLGYDLSGVIVKVGPNVTNWKVGDEVYSRVQDARTGAAGEYLAVSQTHLARKPSNVSFEEAASYPLAALTAYQAFKKIGVKEGSSILITGGAGGVGVFAIQLAKHVFKAGRVVTTASPGEKTEFVKSLGADEVINYRDPTWADTYTDLVDNTFDTAGEAANAIKVTKEGGKVVTVADKPTSADLKEKFPIGFLISFFVDLGSRSLRKAAEAKKGTYNFMFLNANGEDLSTLTTYIEEGKLKTCIDSVYPLDQAAEALARVESGRSKGKVVVKVL